MLFKYIYKDKLFIYYLFKFNINKLNLYLYFIKIKNGFYAIKMKFQNNEINK